MTPRTVAPALALILTAALSACGSSSNDAANDTSGPTSSGASSVPSCGDVWKAGATLPADYDGCMNGDMLEAAAFFTCGDGSKLYQYASDFWAFGGKTIHEEPGGAAGAKAYKAAYGACNS